MKLLVRLAIGLYPSWWRERYEAELRALVEESGESWRTALDIAKGAIVMQLTSLHQGARAWLKCAVLGLAVGALAFLVTPLQYMSAMVVEIESAPGTPAPVPGAGGDANMQDLIRRFDLYATPDAGPALDALRRFRTGVSVTLMPPAGESQEGLAQGFQRAGSMLVAFNYPDPQKAERVTSELARLVVEQNLRNREAQPGGDPRTSGDRFRIRELPAERSIKPALAVGFNAALLAAIAVATRRWVRSPPTTDN
jgi:hypothetical protein